MRGLGLEHSYLHDLPQGGVRWRPAPAPAPRLLHFNHELAHELGLPLEGLDDTTLAEVFVGNRLPEDAQPLAQVYAGHQFGGFSPRLGDGRALLLGERIDRHGRRRDLALKGSGRTPYARGGDGKAAVGPMLREVLMGEAMHALGVPTTRALAVVASGELVRRERPLPGAVLTRVASSHLRVGGFEYFAARGEREALQRLVSHAVARHDPSCLGRSWPALGLLQGTLRRQAELVARWMLVGFVHGVMNTDNMAISGETIDYGPCAFLEIYDPQTVFSSIDHHGRYAFGNQPAIAHWNLARLAEALLPCLADDPEEAVAQATAVLDEFPARFGHVWRIGLRAKLGLTDPGGHPEEGASDADPLTRALARADGAGEGPRARAQADALADDWLALLQASRVDHTLAWRRLADAAEGDEEGLRALWSARGADGQALGDWLARWRDLGRAQEGDEPGVAQARAAARAQRMRRCNPAVIPRNHRVEEALEAATEADDLGPFERLLAAVRRPFVSEAEGGRYAQPAPAGFTESYRTFCGT